MGQALPYACLHTLTLTVTPSSLCGRPPMKSAHIVASKNLLMSSGAMNLSEPGIVAISIWTSEHMAFTTWSNRDHLTISVSVRVWQTATQMLWHAKVDLQCQCVKRCHPPHGGGLEKLLGSEEGITHPLIAVYLPHAVIIGELHACIHLQRNEQQTQS